MPANPTPPVRYPEGVFVEAAEQLHLRYRAEYQRESRIGSPAAEVEFAGLTDGAKGIRTFGPTFVCSAAFGVKKARKPRSSCRGLLALGVSPTHRGSKGDSNPRSHLRGAHNRRSFGRASERGIPPTRRSRSYNESSGASRTLLQRRAEPWHLKRRRQHGNFGSQAGEGEKRWLETG